jgi:hypothetical protein
MTRGRTAELLLLDLGRDHGALDVLRQLTTHLQPIRDLEAVA